MRTIPFTNLRHSVLRCRFHACFKPVTQDINIKLLLNEWNEMLLQLSCKTRLICFSDTEVTLKRNPYESDSEELTQKTKA